MNVSVARDKYKIGDKVIYLKDNKEYVVIDYRADPEFIWISDEETDGVVLTHIRDIKKKESE